MHTYAQFFGVFLIVVGIIYLRKPNVFRRAIWIKTGIAERNLSPEGYIKYMRGVGVFNIVVGIALLVWGYLRRKRMNTADFDKLDNEEKEHFYQCAKCGEFVNKRELRDVIFHESNHDSASLGPSENHRETHFKTFSLTPAPARDESRRVYGVTLRCLPLV